MFVIGVGCGVQRSAEPLEGSGTGAVPSQDTGTGKADTAGDTDPDGGSSGDDPDSMLDVGTAEDDIIEPGCGKVDFLFVVDDSGSMSDNQRNLVANFPALIDGMQSTLGQVDSYHVGVVTSDAYEANVSGCNVMGGLVARTGGADSSETRCGPYAEGHNYMTEADDLVDAFSCAATVGTAGSHQERPVEAMLDALDAEATGACNEGFLREDALLVVVLITDEADGPDDPEYVDHGYPVSPGTPEDWYESIVDAKGGHPENAVVISLVHYYGGACPPPAGFADPRFFDGQNIVDFTDLFGDNGFVRGICSDYGPVFNQAVGIVEEACDNFVPAG